MILGGLNLSVKEIKIIHIFCVYHHKIYIHTYVQTILWFVCCRKLNVGEIVLGVLFGVSVLVIVVLIIVVVFMRKAHMHDKG